MWMLDVGSSGLGDFGRNDRGTTSPLPVPSPLGSAAAMPNQAEFHVNPAQQACIVCGSLVATLRCGTMRTTPSSSS